MPKDHHKNAAASYTKAAKHHEEAGNAYGSGNHEKGAHHAHTARGHEEEGRDHSREASKKHTGTHGNK